jgi:hypothetical protein
VEAGNSGVAEGGGRGLFAVRAVLKGAVVFAEQPALLLQDAGNRASVSACAFCHAFLRRCRRAPIAADRDAGSGEGSGDDGYGDGGEDEARVLSGDECSCSQGCGESYCDVRCRDRHEARGHRVLCVGPLDSWEHPLAALKLAAARDDHGDGNLALLTEMCGRCFAADADAAAAAAAASSSSTASSRSLMGASLHWFVRGAWWDLGVGDGDGDGDGSGGVRRRASLEPRCENYASLLAPAMRSAAASETCDPVSAAPLLDDSGGLVSARGVAELVGLLVRNQLSVVVESPQVQRARELLRRGREQERRRVEGRGGDGDRCDDDEREAKALEMELIAAGANLPLLQSQEQPQQLPQPLDGATTTTPPWALLAAAKDTFPAYDGAGVFPLVCLMNHSCAPNVEVWFDGGYRAGAGCSVVAVRNIAAGEELRQGCPRPLPRP